MNELAIGTGLIRPNERMEVLQYHQARGMSGDPALLSWLGCAIAAELDGGRACWILRDEWTSQTLQVSHLLRMRVPFAV